MAALRPQRTIRRQMLTGANRTLQHTLDEAQTIDRVHEHGARDDGDAPM